MFLFHTLQQQVWTALMLTVSAFAWWRGGPPEKGAIPSARGAPA